MPTQGPPWECPACHRYISNLSITHNSSLTWHTLVLTRLPFQLLNGRSSMATWKKQFLPTWFLPLAKDVDLCMMVDSDHGGEKRTRHSRTGFIIFCNLTPIIWLSKQQGTIEISAFGAKFVAMKHWIEMLRGLRFKIRMMGIPLSGPTYIYGDNKSQVTNSSRHESTLKKKYNSSCYHAIHNLVAMCETLLMHIRTGENLADFLTKITSGTKHCKLVRGVIHDIYDDFPKQ